MRREDRAKGGYLKLVASGELKKRVEMLFSMLTSCTLCPRCCGIDRLRGQRGFCGIGSHAVVASYGKHFGEESVLVGRGGSGTIFMSGCNLKCMFCQNCEISQPGKTIYGENMVLKLFQILIVDILVNI